ncbi:MAG: N-(5'-phosphoribosyl)anthranilate isomerase [Flavobacteriales bacterium]|nr:MAG: N-(5'-phosphoribosyl)anthranilate isomerase [Flavobacteriales bacterium]
MKIKVCGLRDAENIRQIAELQPDYMGFIFYEKSPRFWGDLLPFDQRLEGIKKVGVFVNSTIENIEQKADGFDLDYIQLHGNETAEFCQRLQGKGFKIIKAFQISNDFDFSILKDYKPYCDFFLFDTKTNNYGGSGKQFDWKILENYDNEMPYFLSGGIGLEETEKIKGLKELTIHAIDVNSKFEIEPGLKEVDKLKQLFSKLSDEIRC